MGKMTKSHAEILGRNRHIFGLLQLEECVYAYVEGRGNRCVHQSIQKATPAHVFRIRHQALPFHLESTLRPREKHLGLLLGLTLPCLF